MESFVGFEIKYEESVEFLSHIYPELKDLDYKSELHHHFLVLDYPKSGEYRLLFGSELIDAGITRIEPLNISLITRTLFRE